MTLSKPGPLLHPDEKCNFSRSSLALEEEDKESGSCPADLAQGMEGKPGVTLTVIPPLPLLQVTLIHHST